MIWPLLGITARGLLVAACGLTVGAVLVGGTSPAVSLAMALLLVILAWLFYSREPARGLLFLSLFTAPIDIGKALLTPTNPLVPDAPGLSVSAMDVAALGWAALWLWRHVMVEQRRIRWSRADLVAMAFLGWIWIEAFRSPAASGLGLATAMTYTKFVGVFLLLSHALRAKADWHAVMAACAAIFAIQAMYVLAQVVTQSPLALPGSKLPTTASVVSFGTEGSAFRPMGFFNHPNALADYLVLLLPTPLCLVIMGPRHSSSRAWAIALAILAFGSVLLALTLSRGGWISFAVAMAVCVAMLWRAGAVTGRQIQLGALLLALLIAGVLASTPRLLLRLTEPDSRSLESRSLLASQALVMLEDRPLLGVGFGGYYRASRDYSAPGFAKVSPEYQQSIRQLVVHNHYLLLACELGTPAMLVFVGLMLSLIAGVAPVRRWHDKGRFALAVGLAGALAGNLLFLASDNYYADIRMALLWLVAGLLQALLLERRESVQSAPKLPAAAAMA